MKSNASSAIKGLLVFNGFDLKQIWHKQEHVFLLQSIT